MARALSAPPPVWLLALALALPLAALCSAGPSAFAQHVDCASCVGAGFGWSAKKSKCGGYANKECPASSPSPPPQPPSPPSPPPPPPPPPSPPTPGAVAVTFVDDAPLGLKFGKKPSVASAGWDVVSIATVQGGTQATQHPSLVPGLILESVNGVAVTGLRYSETIQLLKATPRPTTLSFKPGPPPPPPSKARRDAEEERPAAAAALAKGVPQPGSKRDVGVVLQTAG